MKPQTIRFLKNGEAITLHDVPPSRTLLEVLREDLHCTGTKEGCGEGDCGACTVVIGQEHQGKLQTRAINSCIRLAHSVDGLAVWTVEGLSQDTSAPHPVQEALSQCHASQCGFCTPGFAMSLFALYQQHAGQTIDRATAQNALSGNLCRCTGYRPIVEAAQAMQALPAVVLDDRKILNALTDLAALASKPPTPSSYLLPLTLKSLLQLRKQWPDAQLVAGCTDVGLWVTKQHREFTKVIDTTRVKELKEIQHYPLHLAIGAAVTLTDAFAALVADRPQLQSFAHRFAGLPVRNSGTLGGNVANGSPIGDSMPLLIALGAQVILMSTRGHRRMPLENLYTGYRKNVMQADEVLAWIVVPKAMPYPKNHGPACKVYKISKRFEDDISAVCLALDIHTEKGVVTHASIGVGGVAATPVRARATEQVLLGKPWNAATVQEAMHGLRNEFTPISDMRASSAYRREVLGNLLWRYWLESQGQAHLDVQTLEPVGLQRNSAGASV